MMRLTVQYFAIFRDQTGCAEESVDSNAASAADLFQELIARHPGLTRFEQMKVAVNDELCGWDSPLNDGDRVLLFPPVAGG